MRLHRSCTGSLALGAGIFLLLGCGGLQVEALPDPDECPSGLEEIARFEGEIWSKNLLWHDGRLYFDLEPSGGIHVLPDDGGTASLLLDALPWKMWAQGDSIIYVDVGTDRFFSVPFSGGEAQLLADGGTYDFDLLTTIGAQSADADHFYWVRGGVPYGADSTVWAKPRAGGPTIALGELAGVPSPFGVATSPTGEGLLLAAETHMVEGQRYVGQAWVIDKLTWQWRELARFPERWIDGPVVDSNGVYGNRRGDGKDREAVHSMVQADVAGHPLKPFWPTMPAHFDPVRMFPDQAGGWVLSGYEWFSDGQAYESFWSVDDKQVGRRLGCWPEVEDHANLAAAASSPTHLYLSLWTSSDYGGYHVRIMRFPRSP